MSTFADLQRVQKWLVYRVGRLARVSRFCITEIHTEHLVCRTWDGVIKGTKDVLVARPWLLRCKGERALSTGTVTFVYTGTQARTATAAQIQEQQVIVPEYVVNDEITAISPIVRGTGLTLQDGTVVEWTDMNLDARAWAKKTGT